jgi:hypothetical protein
MWENIDNSKESLAFIDDDLLTSFRVTRQAAGNLPAGTLIMGGMTNWYALDETSSRTIAPYLTAGLDLSHRYTLKRPLVALVTDPANRLFTANIELFYENPSEEDRTLIRAKGLFTAAERDGGGEYRLPVTVNGVYYPAPAADREGHTLSSHLSLHLRQKKHQRNPVAAAAQGLAATPFTLIADAFATAIIVPGYIADVTAQ